MSCRTRNLRTSLLWIVVSAIFIAGGCQSRHSDGSFADPAWGSPTANGGQALLVVPTDELKVLEIDGRDIKRSQVAETHGLRAYLIPAGEHAITTSFRFATPVTGQLTGEVRGHPLEHRQFFRAGGEYVALYRIHAYPNEARRWWLEEVVVAVFGGPDFYWSMDIVDLANVDARLATGQGYAPMPMGRDMRVQLDAWHRGLAEQLAAYLNNRPDIAPEVREALLCRSFPAEMNETARCAAASLTQ